MPTIGILGASGHGKVVAEIAELNGYSVTFFDDTFPEESRLEHWGIIGNSRDLISKSELFDATFVAIGANDIRAQMHQALKICKAKMPALIHPRALVSQYARIQEGTVVMANAVINPFVQVGRGCIVNTSCSIDHDCILGDFVHLSPGVGLAGAVKIEDLTWIGMGASVKQCVVIGKNVMVGAGALVLNDIEADRIAFGVPAKLKPLKIE